MEGIWPDSCNPGLAPVQAYTVLLSPVDNKLDLFDDSLLVLSTEEGGWR